MNELKNESPTCFLSSFRLFDAIAEDELKKTEKAAPWIILKKIIKIKSLTKIKQSEDAIIKANAIRHNIFFPYLSIKVAVYGVNNIDEKPKVDITIPISDFE